MEVNNIKFEGVDLTQFLKDELIGIIEQVCILFAEDSIKMIKNHNKEVKFLKLEIWLTIIVSLAALVSAIVIMST